MSFVATFLLAQAAAATPAYPLTPVLDEARETCALMTGSERMDLAVAARGWNIDDEAPSGWLAGYLKDNDGLESVFGQPVFYELRRKSVAGRDLLLYMFGVGPEANSARKWRSCEVMDLAATGSIDRSAVVAWAGREPLPSIALGDAVLERWVPALSPNSADSAVTYSPPGSPLADMRPGLIYTLVAKTEKPGA